MGHKKNKKEQIEDKQSGAVKLENPTEETAQEARRIKKLKKKRQEDVPPDADSTEQNSVEDKKGKRKKKDKKVHFKTEGTDSPLETGIDVQNSSMAQDDLKQDTPITNTVNDDSHNNHETNHTALSVNEMTLQQEEEHGDCNKRDGQNEEKTEKIRGRKPNNLEDDKGIDWPEKDLNELFKRMEAAIPEKDTLAYSTRAEKLNWDDITFKNYTGEECKCTWLLVQKRLRRFRLLSELLQDAKEWTRKPWTNFYGGQKTKRHPDMPRRPLSTYMLFYLHKKDKIISENPGVEMTEISKIITQMYKALSPLKREKYMKEAAEKRRIYENELEEFYRQHPEIGRTVEKTVQPKHVVDLGPKKPNTPFSLFYESQLKSLDANTSVDKHAFKEQIKEQWKNMSDKKKVMWINWASEAEAKYQDELKNYISQNPDFVPVTLKPVLTKEEKILKEKMAGKPTKPPNSAYSLFSRMMLQSEEIKEVNPKDRMVYIAEKWKNCTEEERKEYSERILHLREQYKLDFASYLESLPEDKRQEEIRSTLPKRKRTLSKTEEKEMKKKKPDTETSSLVLENNNVKTMRKLEKKPEEARKGKKSDEEKADAKEDEKLSPFAKPRYWNRMKKEEKRTFRNAMMKLKEHLDSRFEKYINSRGSDTSEEDSDTDGGSDAEESSSSS